MKMATWDHGMGHPSRPALLLLGLLGLLAPQAHAFQPLGSPVKLTTPHTCGRGIPSPLPPGWVNGGGVAARPYSLAAVVAAPNRGGGENHDAIPRTMPEAVATFLLGPYVGPRLTLAILAAAAAYRLSLPLTVVDAALFGAAVVFWWFQEHWMHKHLLHSRFDWYGKAVHAVHHEKNYFHVSLDPAPLMVGWLCTAGLLFRLVLPGPWALTTTLGYAAAGLYYEWSHYIVHTKVRFPKGSYFQRMKDHHIRHHLVDADNWLGFSLPQVDDLFGTNPDVKEFRRHETEAER